MFREPVHLSLVGCTPTEANCDHSVFDVSTLVISTKMSVCAVNCNHFKIRYSGKHTLFNDESYLCFFHIHMRTSSVVMVTMAMKIGDIIVKLYSHAHL